MFLTSLKQTCNEYLIKFSENQSTPKLENRKTSPCAPNLLHVLVSRIPGYHNLCSPGQEHFSCKIRNVSVFWPFLESLVPLCLCPSSRLTQAAMMNRPGFPAGCSLSSIQVVFRCPVITIGLVIPPKIDDLFGLAKRAYTVTKAFCKYSRTQTKFHAIFNIFYFKKNICSLPERTRPPFLRICQLSRGGR